LLVPTSTPFLRQLRVHCIRPSLQDNHFTASDAVHRPDRDATTPRPGCHHPVPVPRLDDTMRSSRYSLLAACDDPRPHVPPPTMPTRTSSPTMARLLHLRALAVSCLISRYPPPQRWYPCEALSVDASSFHLPHFLYYLLGPYRHADLTMTPILRQLRAHCICPLLRGNHFTASDTIHGPYPDATTSRPGCHHPVPVPRLYDAMSSSRYPPRAVQ
jgi:hypothetical protein